jgi:glutamate dehydrogenase
VRARVIGEGGNLGCTQAGRIDYGLHGAQGVGGRDNPDFIDNSAGVDCSDKEVNIKIALASAKRAGRLDEDGRVALLSSMTDDVAALVLEDNRLQALGLSIAESGGAAAVPGYVRLIEVLEEGGHLDRRTEGLADADTFHRRAEDGDGFTRPELAVLLSSAKLVLQDALEKSGVLDDPGMEGDLLAAFPPAMRDTYRVDILNHRLRREILATRFANRVINRLGFIHPFELAEEEGVSLADVASAFRPPNGCSRWVRCGTPSKAARWRNLRASCCSNARRKRCGAIWPTCCAPARRRNSPRCWPPALPALDQMAGVIDGLLVSEARSGSARLRAELSVAGANEAELANVVRLFDLDGAVGIAALAHSAGLDAVAVASAFTRLGSVLGLDWAQATAAPSPSDPWERLLVGGLARDFQQMRLDALRRWNGGDPVAAVDDWLMAQTEGVARFCAMIERARKVVPTTPALLAQIAGQARGLLAR